MFSAVCASGVSCVDAQGCALCTHDTSMGSTRCAESAGSSEDIFCIGYRICGVILISRVVEFEFCQLQDAAAVII
jgi:hypothetical protein